MTLNWDSTLQLSSDKSFFFKGQSTHLFISINLFLVKSTSTYPRRQIAKYHSVSYSLKFYMCCYMTFFKIVINEKQTKEDISTRTLKQKNTKQNKKDARTSRLDTSKSFRALVLMSFLFGSHL